MKGFRTLVLAAVIALPACEEAVVDPSFFDDIALSLTRDRAGVPYVTAPNGAPPEESIDGALTLIVDPAKFRPRSVAIAWSLQVDPPEAGSVEPASGQFAAVESSNRLSDPVYRGGFRTRFVAAKGYRGRVIVKGTAQVVEQNTDLDAKAEARLEFSTESGTDDAPLPTLQLTCRRQPSAGTAPLSVTFSAVRSGCAGACTVVWEFGTGEKAEGNEVSYVYTSPGEYDAVGILRDGLDRIATCQKTVSVEAPAPRPQPSTPSPSSPTSPGSLG